MVSMDNWATQAHEKIQKEQKSVSGQKEKAMATAVCAMLNDFCKQEPEFAQAVVQGGSIQACMEAVAKGVGSSISDLDAYKRAVQFFFPGAEIQMQMSIDLIGAAGEPDPAEKVPSVHAAGEKPAVGKINLDLSSFF